MTLTLVYGTYIAGTILTPYAKSLGATGIYIGIISGALYFVRLFVGTSIGRLADKRGVLSVLKISLLLYPLVALSYWAAGNIPTLILARLLHGLASAMMLPMAMAYMAEVSPLGKEGHYMGIYNTIILTASGLGPQTATIIADKFKPKDNFLLLFIMAVISLLIVIMLGKNKRNTEKNISSSMETKGKYCNTLIELLRDPSLLALGSINVALAVISSLIGFFFILFPPTKGINLIFTGSIIAIYNLICGVSQIPIGRFTDRFNKYVLILFSGLLTSIVLILFPFVNQLWVMILAIIALALASAILLSASSALSTILGRDLGMGSTMGFLGTSTSIGMILGSIFLSLMPDRFGINSIFYLSSSIVFIGSTLFLVLWSRKIKIKFWLSKNTFLKETR